MNLGKTGLADEKSARMIKITIYFSLESKKVKKSSEIVEVRSQVFRCLVTSTKNFPWIKLNLNEPKDGCACLHSRILFAHLTETGVEMLWESRSRMLTSALLFIFPCKQSEYGI